MANNNSSSGGMGSTIIGIILVLLILAALGSCTSGGSSSSSSSKSSKCQVCGRTFTNKDDVRSIAYRNMCESCYSNYKYSQELKEAAKKIQERSK
jgi:protein-arginine kinase activator protein McsA